MIAPRSRLTPSTPSLTQHPAHGDSRTFVHEVGRGLARQRLRPLVEACLGESSTLRVWGRQRALQSLPSAPLEFVADRIEDEFPSVLLHAVDVLDNIGRQGHRYPFCGRHANTVLRHVPWRQILPHVQEAVNAHRGTVAHEPP